MEILTATSASDLIAAVGTNTATTFASILPVAAVVVGVVLAIGLASWVISMFKKALSNRK